MSRRPLSGLYDDTEAETIFCLDCERCETCPKKGLPKVTAANRWAFSEFVMIKEFPAYMPRPLTAALRERLQIIAGEIRVIEENQRRKDAGTNPQQL